MFIDSTSETLLAMRSTARTAPLRTGRSSLHAMIDRPTDRSIDDDRVVGKIGMSRATDRSN